MDASGKSAAGPCWILDGSEQRETSVRALSAIARCQPRVWPRKTVVDGAVTVIASAWTLFVPRISAALQVGTDELVGIALAEGRATAEVFRKVFLRLRERALHTFAFAISSGVGRKYGR